MAEGQQRLLGTKGNNTMNKLMYLGLIATVCGVSTLVACSSKDDTPATTTTTTATTTTTTTTGGGGSTTTTTTGGGGMGTGGMGAGGNMGNQACIPDCKALFACGLGADMGMQRCPGFGGAGVSEDDFVAGCIQSASCTIIGGLLSGGCAGGISASKGASADFKKSCEGM